MIKKHLYQKKNFFSKKVYSNQPEKQYKKMQFETKLKEKG